MVSDPKIEWRLHQHPILEFPRSQPFHFDFEGQPIKAYQGETVAAALHAAGIRLLRHSHKFGQPRGFFCAVGRCSSCLMVVDGLPNVMVCMTLASPGMKVSRQKGKGRIIWSVALP